MQDSNGIEITAEYFQKLSDEGEQARLSGNWGKDMYGNRNEDMSGELDEIVERLDNSEWKPKEPENPFLAALEWQKKRINRNPVQHIMHYENARYLFSSFWKSYLPENQEFYLHPDNKKTVQNIIKWAIGDPESEIDLNKSIWLWGCVGAGKSVFACALRDFFDYLVNPHETMNLPGRKWDFADMNGLFVTAKFDPSAFKVLNTSYGLILDELKEQHFIIKSFGQEQKIIGDLISARYSAWKKSNVRTFVTTNLPPSFTNEFPVLDDREVDRMVEMFTSIEWHGSSLRKN